MTDRYTVEAWVSPDYLFGEFEAPTLDEVIVIARDYRDFYDATLAFANIEHCDVDTNGLTDAENERLEEEGLI